MRGTAILLVLGALSLGACHNEQTVYRCRACLHADPTKCAVYEGDCYGPASNSMPASSTAEAQELAAQRVCMRYFEPIPPGGPSVACKIGISYSAQDRAAGHAQWDYQCSSRVVNCD